MLLPLTGNNSRLLWFTSYAYDVGQDIWLGCQYYSALNQSGSASGSWYAPDGTQEGRLQLYP
jgi:hypothetical protein